MKLLSITAAQTARQRPEAYGNPQGFSVECVSTPQQGIYLMHEMDFDVVLASWPLSGWSAEDVLSEVQRVNRSVPVVLQMPSGTLELEDAARLTKLGAYHVVGDSIGDRDLHGILESAVEHRRSRDVAHFRDAIEMAPWRKLLVGDSRAMRNVADLVRLVGPRKCTVLISGETGTGKELVARAIHMASPRAALPMVSVNCSALPENLLEAELFGHTRGAFTGATTQRVGRFEQAQHSTLFLDEIGDMPIELQSKLLRVLQEREFQRLGSSETIRVDVRVIAASNVDLVERIREGRFREDLYYRLNVVPLNTPPLRERRDDTPSLVHHFIAKICRNEDLPLKNVSSETLERLAAHSWPGNVRQLENAVEMAVALSGDRMMLYPGDFPLAALPPRKTPAAHVDSMVRVPDEGLDYEATVGRIERNILSQALEKSGGNKKLAAELLRLKRTTFAAKLKSLDLAPAC